MTSFFETIKDLFQKKNINEPIVKEALVRNEQYVIEYNQWIAEGRFSNFQSYLRQQFTIAEKASLPNDVFNYINTPQFSGIILYEMPDSKPQTWRFILDTCVAKLKHFGYVKQLSDIRHDYKAASVSKIERYYLKKRALANDFKSDTKINQLFGNLLLELEYKDNNFKQLKIQANYYTDSKFHKPTHFGELVSLLVS